MVFEVSHSEVIADYLPGKLLGQQTRDVAEQLVECMRREATERSAGERGAVQLSLYRPSDRLSPSRIPTPLVGELETDGEHRAQEHLKQEACSPGPQRADRARPRAGATVGCHASLAYIIPGVDEWSRPVDCPGKPPPNRGQRVVEHFHRVGEVGE